MWHTSLTILDMTLVLFSDTSDQFQRIKIVQQRLEQAYSQGLKTTWKDNNNNKDKT